MCMARADTIDVRHLLLSALVLLGFGVAGTSRADTVVVTADRMIDVVAGRVIEHPRITITDGRIMEPQRELVPALPRPPRNKPDGNIGTKYRQAQIPDKRKQHQAHVHYPVATECSVGDRSKENSDARD